MKYFALIDTETTWSGALMTAGILIVEEGTLNIVDYKYYVNKDSLSEGGMYEHVIHIKGLKEESTSSTKIESAICKFLDKYSISSIFAYNASFDKKVLPCLSGYHWHDIMHLAAYKQYNPAIPKSAKCCSTGRLKSGYGVESIMRLFGYENYFEMHNALVDAKDELEIMKNLGHSVSVYPEL